MVEFLNSLLSVAVGTAVGALMGLLPCVLLFWRPEWWLTRRAQRDWDRGEPERRHQWAEEDRRQALQHQLRELQEAIREERLSDDAREWRRQYRACEAAIRQAARRRSLIPDPTSSTVRTMVPSRCCAYASMTSHWRASVCCSCVETWA